MIDKPATVELSDRGLNCQRSPQECNATNLRLLSQASIDEHLIRSKVMKFNIALLQMIGCGFDKDASRIKGERFCRLAKTSGADVVLFPEMWSVGMTFFDKNRRGAHEAWQEQAIERDDAFIDHFRSLAKELEMAIAITYLEKWPGRPRNSVSLIDQRGDIVLTYAKVHTCEFDL